MDDFERLVEAHRAELHAHCYRMLGSLQDAEDALQDTLVRAWRGSQAVRERAALRGWLYRIATNVCLDALQRRRARMLPSELGPPLSPRDDPGELQDEAAWIEPYPDEPLGLEEGRATPAARYEQREAVELAFVAALQHLPPTQRAVLILREVLGFSAREVAESLGTTAAAVNSALQRARRTLSDRLPARSQQQTVRALGDTRARALVRDFMDAWQRADIETVATLLTDDARFSMPPAAAWWRGRDAITELIAYTRARCPPSRFLPTQVNGQLALACYLEQPARGGWQAATLTAFELDGARVKHVTSFVHPHLFARFELPASLPS